MRLSGITNFYFMIKKIDVHKGHGQLRLRDGWDLLAANNSFSYNISSLINLEQRFFLMSIKNSITTEWPSLIKTSVDVTIADPIQSIPTIKMVSGNLVPILDISPRQIYEIFL